MEVVIMVTIQIHYSSLQLHSVVACGGNSFKTI